MPPSGHEHPVDSRAAQRARSRLPSAGETERVTSVLTLLAHPTRLRVLYALDEVEELCVGDLALALQISEDSVGYALRLLRTAGLVTRRKEGRTVFYRLAGGFPEPLRQHCLMQLAAMLPLGATTSPSPRSQRTRTHAG
ncbi:MAG TPA: metalloregulator ArsR/SmtB family transcription factor [Nocardioidaceae bacterium]